MLKPLNGNLIVKVKDIETKTEGGLILSRGSSRDLVEAEVMETESLQNSIPKNAVVVFQQKNGVPINHEGVDYLIVKEEDVLAIIK